MPKARDARKPPERRAHKTHLIVRSLLTWFSHNARNLPWRQTLDPYAIWVSEIMLQQTQVKTVIPYWNRWMRALPTVQAVARAKTETLLKLWEGLGYYTRARNLQLAARAILKEHGGVFPRDFEQILALPGVGRYTAGAISSIAYNSSTPILDGNVIRVVCRLFGIGGNPAKAVTKTRLWQLAEDLVQQASREVKDYHTWRARRCAGNCSMLNQALMELGAVVCTPRNSRCETCPVRSHCQALRSDQVANLPRPKPRVRALQRRLAVFVATCRGKILIQRRPADSLNGGLWEFPHAEFDPTQANLPDLVRSLVGAVSRRSTALCTIRHSITRHRFTAEAHWIEIARKPGRVQSGARWVRLQRARALPFTAAHRRILECYLAQTKERFAKSHKVQMRH